MKREMLEQMLARASESVRKLNKDLARVCPSPQALTTATPVKSRIRQDRSQPNKLEREWMGRLLLDFPDEQFHFNAMRFRLGNGVWYKPDFFCFDHYWPEDASRSFKGIHARPTAWEVKGPKAWRGGFEFLKIAAHAWPKVRWVLVWKDDGGWNEEEVLP